MDPQAIARAITPDTTSISVALANNELGTIQPLAEIARIVHAVRLERAQAGNHTPLWFHTDASQGAGQLELNPARFGVDAMTLNAGKMYGPKQVGLLLLSRHIRLQPSIVGGGQERGLRSGTENVAGVIGFAAAFELADSHRKSESERLRKLRDTIEQRLLSEFSNAVVLGSRKHRLPGHLHISFPGLDAERLIFALEARGVLVATGSACAANYDTRSHVLTAIGVSDSVADGSLRITLGRLIDEPQAQVATDHIIAIVKAEYERVGV